MPGPFPGMDPYLEASNLWHGIHLQLINNIVADLQPQLIPRYIARPEECVFLEPLNEVFYPDATLREYSGRVPRGEGLVRTSPTATGISAPEIIQIPEWRAPQRFVAILDVSSRRVVTVLEVLSPWNKTSEGRKSYREKQHTVLMSEANLVEIDLLRGGRSAIAVPESLLQPSDYRVCVHRTRSDQLELVRWQVRDPLPNVAIPLRSDDSDVILHLEPVLNRCYEEGAYAYELDYDADPVPKLSHEDTLWARERIARWRAERGHQTSSG